MLHKEILQALNNQIEVEAYSSFLYLSMAVWTDQKNMVGCTNFFYRQSDEERMHMLKLYYYISEMDEKAITPSIDQPPADFGTIRELWEMVYAQEQKVTESINRIVELCYKHNDYTTLNFLQWYIEEQREEEVTVRSVLDKIKLIGDGPLSLYYIDKEVEAVNNTAGDPEVQA